MFRVVTTILVVPTILACAQTTSGEKDAAPAAAPVVETAALPSEAEVASGVTVAGQPSRAQLEAAAARGIKTVINLRGVDEPGALADEQQIVEGAGMRYVQWDAGKGAAALTPENARRLADALAGEGPFLVHCGGGGRATAVYALKTVVVDGQSADDAKALVERTGNTKLLEKLLEKIAELPAE